MSRIVRRVVLMSAVAALLFALAPSPAHAGSQALRRSVQNMAFAPLDFALSPVVTGRTVWREWRSSDDTQAVKVVYLVPGYFWQTGVSMGASVLRGVSGALEFLPGLALVPFETELDPIYDLVENQEALVDLEVPGFQIRFGIDYLTPGY